MGLAVVARTLLAVLVVPLLSSTAVSVAPGVRGRPDHRKRRLMLDNDEHATIFCATESTFTRAALHPPILPHHVHLSRSRPAP